jgi:hypothetical protein
MKMGIRTDRQIAAWQRKAGIEPATGGRAQILNELSRAAFDAIKIIELERSGIRDGDGYWHGGDVIGGMTGDLTELCARLMETYKVEETACVIDPGSRTLQQGKAAASWIVCDPVVPSNDDYPF